MAPGQTQVRSVVLKRCDPLEDKLRLASRIDYRSTFKLNAATPASLVCGGPKTDSEYYTVYFCVDTRDWSTRGRENNRVAEMTLRLMQHPAL